MEDKSLDVDKNSASETKETGLLSPQKGEQSPKEVKQLSPKSSDLSHGVEFSKLDDDSAKAPEQENITSIHFHQANKESEILESENEISKSSTSIKTKMCEEPIVDAGTKRHKSHHSTSDRKIEDKPMIPADPACRGINIVESNSPRPSTSAGADCSNDSLELQVNLTNRNQEFPRTSLQAIGVNDESSTSPSTSVRMFQGDKEITVYSSCDENTKRDNTIAGPLYSCSNESAKDSTTSQSSERTSLRAKEITGLSKIEVNVTMPFSLSPSMYADSEDSAYSYNYADGKESSSSSSTSVRMFQGDQEITIHSSCDENTKRDDTITDPLHSCSNESAKDSTTSQSSERTFLLAKEITVLSKGEGNATMPPMFFSTSMYPDSEDSAYSFNYEDQKESPTSVSASVTMTQEDKEIAVHSSCDENARQEEIAVHSSCDENARQEEIASGSSTIADESENLGCTSAQEGSHKNSLEKA